MRSSDKFSPHELAGVGGLIIGWRTLSDGLDSLLVGIGLSLGGVGCLEIGGIGDGIGLYFLSDFLCVERGGVGGGGVFGLGGTTSHIE